MLYSECRGCFGHRNADRLNDLSTAGISLNQLHLAPRDPEGFRQKPDHLGVGGPELDLHDEPNPRGRCRDRGHALKNTDMISDRSR